jgi:hypothetical protein
LEKRSIILFKAVKAEQNNQLYGLAHFDLKAEQIIIFYSTSLK